MTRDARRRIAEYRAAEVYWSGRLFDGLRAPLIWHDSAKGHYESLAPPKSVTFPICTICSRIIWDWPHFEEPVPDNACCGPCSVELDE
jgi:hypothetical protein